MHETWMTKKMFSSSLLEIHQQNKALRCQKSLVLHYLSPKKKVCVSQAESLCQTITQKLMPLYTQT